MTTAAKKAPARKAPAKKALAKADPASPASLTPAVEADVVDLSDVPSELQFSSDNGNRRDPEQLPIAIDGNRHILTQPSNAFLALVASGVFSGDSTEADQIRAMLQIVRVCLDPAGVSYVDQRIRATDNSFDDELLGSLTATILNRWAPEIAKDAKALEAKPANRATRRQAARG